MTQRRKPKVRAALGGGRVCLPSPRNRWAENAKRDHYPLFDTDVVAYLEAKGWIRTWLMSPPDLTKEVRFSRFVIDDSGHLAQWMIPDPGQPGQSVAVVIAAIARYEGREPKDVHESILDVAAKRALKRRSGS